MPKTMTTSTLWLGSPATKVTDLPAVVTDDVVETARRAAKRVHGRAAPVRRRFIRRGNPSDEKPTLARMLKGGRGGAAKLKVYLSLLWLGAGGNHEVTFPAQNYARMLGLADPYRNGARRVRDAFEWLEENRLVSVQRRPGHVPTVTLLREDGLGDSYEVPGAADRDPQTNKALPINLYLQLPAGFWTSGWAAYLDAPAIAVLLLLLSESRGRRKHGIWISPSELTDWYAFSDDTRRRGVTALEDAGLVYVSRVPVDPNSFDRRRVRNVYSIEPALLNLQIDADAKSRWSKGVELLGMSPREAWLDYVDGRVPVKESADNQLPPTISG